MNSCSASHQLSSGSTRIGHISCGASAPIKKRGLMNVLGKSHQVGASVGEAWCASMGVATDYLAPISSHILLKLRACKTNVFAVVTRFRASRLCCQQPGRKSVDFIQVLRSLLLSHIIRDGALEC